MDRHEEKAESPLPLSITPVQRVLSPADKVRHGYVILKEASRVEARQPGGNRGFEEIEGGAVETSRMDR